MIIFPRRYTQCEKCENDQCSCQGRPNSYWDGKKNVCKSYKEESKAQKQIEDALEDALEDYQDWFEGLSGGLYF